ncbi:MAG: AAA family ATPase, partial [Deltaproteobacteria bacterium]|nr:AAA family ATPase [Deltaproteobacteria bacterium]
MLRLVELHVRKFRDLVDGGPLRFGPGPVFLLGPNGSGKTTLLELIGVLLGDDLGPLFKEEDAVELSWVLEAEGEGETPATRL